MVVTSRAERSADAERVVVELMGVRVGVRADLRRHAHTVPTPAAEPSGRSTQLVVTLPANAIVGDASATVSARAPGRTPLSGIAQVRAPGDDPAADATSLVIDLGGFATVSGLDLPVDVAGVSTWAGSAFTPITGVSVEGGRATFPGEVMTTKLLVTLTEAGSPTVVQSDGFASLPAVPAGLSVSVDGVTVWRGDPALVLGKGTGEAAAVVDVTAALRAAVGEVPRDVPVGLLVDQPGVISLSVDAPLLLTHDVDLGPAPPAVAASEEGDQPFVLALPAEASRWSVHHVVATVDAAPDPAAERVLPEVGPDLSPLYQLTTGPGRVLLVRLATGPLGRLARLTGVRLPVVAGPEGAELGGVVLADADGRPGAAVDGGVLTPTTLAAPGAGAVVGPAWTTLPVTAPVDVAPGASLWLSLQVARGAVSLAVARPGAGIAADAPVYRLDATGNAVALSHVRAQPAPLGAVRLVGVPPDTAPVSPARLLLPGGAGAAVTPGVPTTISPATPEHPAAGPSLTLTLRVAAPTTYRLLSVRLVYEEADG